MYKLIEHDFIRHFDAISFLLLLNTKKLVALNAFQGIIKAFISMLPEFSLCVRSLGSPHLSQISCPRTHLISWSKKVLLPIQYKGNLYMVTLHGDSWNLMFDTKWAFTIICGEYLSNITTDIIPSWVKNICVLYGNWWSQLALSCQWVFSGSIMGSLFTLLILLINSYS